MNLKSRTSQASNRDEPGNTARPVALLLLGLAVGMALCGCGGENSVQPELNSAGPTVPADSSVIPQSRQEAPGSRDALSEQLDTTGFPAFPAYQNGNGAAPLRQQSLIDTLSLSADQYHLKSDQAFIDGAGSMVLPEHTEDYNWCMFRFDGFVQDDEVFGISVELAEPYPAEYYLGVADYDLQRWRWYRIIAPNASHNFGVPAYINAVNPAGQAYFAMLANGMPVSLVSATLDSSMDSPPPVGIRATDGTRPDRIELSWEDMALSYPGLDYDAVVIERAFAVAGPWEQIGEVAEGISEFADVNDPDTNQLPYDTEVYYSLRTRYGAETGPRGQVDTGSRLLADVAGLSATDGDWAEQIRITWEPIAGAQAYEIEYMADDNGGLPVDWTPLVTVQGELANLFDHSLTSPAAQPSILSTTYRYRVRAAYDLDRSIQWSAAETGYRTLSLIENFSAAEGASPEEVSIVWDPVASATGYVLQYQNAQGGAPVQWTELAQNPVDQTTFLHAFDSPVGMECGYNTLYNYRVKPLLGAEAADVWTQSEQGFRVLQDVTGFSATTNLFQDSIELSWDSLEHCDGYEIEYINDNGGVPVSWSFLTFVNGNQSTGFSHSSTEPTGRASEANTDYRYRIRAGFITDRSLQWTVASGSRYLDTPLNLQASDQWFAGKISLSWDPVEGATGYAIYRDQQTAVHATTGSGTTTYDDVPADFDAHTYWVTALDAASESGFSDPSTGERIEWIIQVVSSGADVGQYASLEAIGLKPAIAFLNADDNSLYYAAANTSLPVDTGDWSVHELTAPLGSGPAGVFNGIVELPNGNPAVCFCDESEFYLYFASADSPTPSSSANWSIHEVDNTGFTGMFNSVAIIDGKPAIAFYNGSLQYAAAAVALPTQTSDWTIHEVDNSGDCGWYASLMDIGGVPAISYYEYSPGYDLRFALASSASPVSGADWTKHAAATDNDTGRYCSLSSDASKPVIASMNHSYGDLQVSSATGSAPQNEGDWQTETVDTAGFTGMYTGIVMVDGLPVVCSYNETDKVLRLSKAVTIQPAGTVDWVSHTVDASGDVGTFADLQVINDQLAIAYYDADNLELKYARTN